ncbi:MAG: TauD/TfdA family dioxygenase [Rhodospirillales bacterium]|nr:TauD/TfdA family dioxygenase [Rhodospirillales bacterium]
MTNNQAADLTIEDSTEWRGPDVAGRTDWLRSFNDVHIAEVADALAKVEAKGLGLGEFGREDFPLPSLSDELLWVREQLQDGRGFAMLRGFPVSDYTKDQLRLIYWGVGQHVGTPLAQSRHGDVLGDVSDIGGTSDAEKGRGYTGSDELTYHSDGCDITALFCLNVAKEGGLSQLVSAAALHNEIARRRPDLLKVLYAPYYWSHRGQELPGTSPHYRQPVFAVEKGFFVSRFLRSHIEWGHLSAGVEMTQDQNDALQLLEEISIDRDFMLEKEFQPGDMQFSNNLAVYHARTEFTDHEDEARKRHLLRMWLAVPNSRPLPESFKAYFRETGAGAVRGGNQAWQGTTYRTTEAV